MVQQATVTSKTKRPRPMSLQAVGMAVQAGATIRRGTVLRSAFPTWEFQVFSANGEFMAAVAASALPQAVTAYGCDKRPGINR